MTPQIQPDAANSAQASSGVAQGRRRLLRGGLASAPVLLSLVSKPVSAATCTPASSFASINLSRPGQAYNCGGRTPGYWKQPCKFYDWPLPYIPSSTAVICPAQDTSYTPPLNGQATKFDDVFGMAGGYPGKTLVEALAQGGNAMGKDALTRHIVAALLNAAKGITPTEVLSVATVKNIWASFISLGYYEPTAGIRWYPDYTQPASPGGGLTGWLKTTMPV